MLKKHIKATNIELTPAISDYVDKKVDVLNKFIGEEIDALAKIEVGKTTNHHNKGDIFRAEINLTIGKKDYRAVVETSDLYAAIDDMKDEIVAEVSKAKRKHFHLLKKGHQKIKDFLKGFRSK